MDGQRAAEVLLQVYELRLHCKLFLLSEMKHAGFNWKGVGDLTGTLNVSTAASSSEGRGLLVYSIPTSKSTLFYFPCTTVLSRNALLKLIEHGTTHLSLARHKPLVVDMTLERSVIMLPGPK